VLCEILQYMNVTLGPRTGLHLNSPVIAASGTFGYGTEYASTGSFSGLGAIVCKGTTRQPRTGNEPLRLTETAAGMLNAIGLQNIGIEALIREKAPIWATWDVPVLVNVSGNSINECAEMAAMLDGVAGIAGIELNISCPNVKEGGVAFGTDPPMAASVTAAVRRETSLPLMVKLSPNVTDIRPIALAVESSGADAISLINTVFGMAVDTRRRAPLITQGYGGLSGPAVKPLALYLVHQVAQTVSIPIVGIGGIMSGADAVEFLLVGASAVAVATLLLVDPSGWRLVNEEIETWCRHERVGDLREIIGTANRRYKGRAGERWLTGS
jgi:dihydroorotate dehydrogenase (NAD+) catalytic subunit